MGYTGNSIVKCLRCGKEGLQKDLNIVENADGHCGIGDLTYIKHIEEWDKELSPEEIKEIYKKIEE